MDNDLKQVLAVFAVIIGFGSGYFLCRYENKEAIETGKKFEVFSKIDKTVRENGSIQVENDKKAVEAAVNAYFKDSDDYFIYYSDDSVSSKELNLNASDMLTDNGFQIAASPDGNMSVVSVEEGSYAQQQGLMTGDVIVDIDGTNIAETGFAVSAGKLLGKNGTTAEITLIRNGELVKISYIRQFEKNMNEVYEMLEGDICYIKYTRGFTDMNYGCFASAIEECDATASGYIIDMRNNPGGLTSTALNILGHFIGEREVGEMHNADGSVEKMMSLSHEIQTDKNVIILVNEKSASSAEIFTAAMMQFYNNVTVAGVNTFGKGIFQMSEKLDDGGAFQYTSGYYTIGKWQCYQGVGIAPDVTVEMDSDFIGTDEDLQLQKAVELLDKAK